MDAGERFKASLHAVLGSFTKAEISRESGIGRSVIDAYLSGSSVPSLNQAERLARACGSTLEDFLQPKKGRAEKPSISPTQALRVLARFVRERS